MIKNKTEKLPIASIIIGLLLCSNMLVIGVSYLIPIPNLFPIFVFALSALWVFLNFDNLKINIYLLAFLMIMAMQVFCGFATIGNDTANAYFFSFICVGLLPALAGYHRIDINVVSLTIVISGIVTCWYPINIILLGSFSLASENQMGVSYSLLPLLFSSIIIITSGSRRIHRLLAVITLVLSAITIFMQATRGAILSAAVFAIVYTLYRVNGKNDRNAKTRFVIIALIVIIAVILLMPFITSSEWYERVFSRKQDDVLNGRTELYEQSLEWQGPLAFFVGSGCGSFQSIHNYNGLMYPHNIFLQLYFEQGIFVALIVLFVCFLSIVMMIKKSFDREHKTTLLFLFCATIIRLNFSYYFWIDPIFWIFVAQVLYSLKFLRKR